MSFFADESSTSFDASSEGSRELSLCSEESEKENNERRASETNSLIRATEKSTAITDATGSLRESADYLTRVRREIVALHSARLALSENFHAQAARTVTEIESIEESVSSEQRCSTIPLPPVPAAVPDVLSTPTPEARASDSQGLSQARKKPNLRALEDVTRRSMTNSSQRVPIRAILRTVHTSSDRGTSPEKSERSVEQATRANTFLNSRISASREAGSHDLFDQLQRIMNRKDPRESETKQRPRRRRDRSPERHVIWGENEEMEELTIHSPLLDITPHSILK